MGGYQCPTRVHAAVGVGVLERGLDALADQGAAAVETLAWILSSTSTECPASAAAGNVAPMAPPLADPSTVEALTSRILGE